MSNILERLTPFVYGTDPARFEIEFVNDALGGTLLDPNATTPIDLHRAAVDEHYFWESSTLFMPGIAHGRHPSHSMVNTDRAWGQLGQAYAFEWFGRWPTIRNSAISLDAIESWLSQLESHEIKAWHSPKNRKDDTTQPSIHGGFPGWLGPVVHELRAIEYELTECVNYDDYNTQGIMEGCALCAAVGELAGDKDIQSRATAIATRLGNRIVYDAERNGWMLGIIHHAVTGQILAERPHVPPCPSSDATASAMWSMLVLYALTQYGPWFSAAEVLRGNLVTFFRRHNGTFPQFITNAWSSSVAQPRGYSLDRKMVNSADAWSGRYDEVTGDAIMGLPPSPTPPKLLARADAWIKKIGSGT